MRYSILWSPIRVSTSNLSDSEQEDTQSQDDIWKECISNISLADDNYEPSIYREEHSFLISEPQAMPKESPQSALRGYTSTTWSGIPTLLAARVNLSSWSTKELEVAYNSIMLVDLLSSPHFLASRPAFPGWSLPVFGFVPNIRDPLKSRVLRFFIFLPRYYYSLATRYLCIEDGESYGVGCTPSLTCLF